MAGDAILTRRQSWIAALLLGSVATPAAVILAVPAPVPLDAILAWPLVVMDRWVGASGAGAPVRVLAIFAGIALTWVHYILLARLVLWRLRKRSTLPSR
jgi:hypothetical protein